MATVVVSAKEKFDAAVQVIHSLPKNGRPKLTYDQCLCLFSSSVVINNLHYYAVFKNKLRNNVS